MLSTRWLLLAMLIGAVVFEATLACGSSGGSSSDDGGDGGDDGGDGGDDGGDGGDDGGDGGEGEDDNKAQPENNEEIENNPCYNEALGTKMEEVMNANDVNSAPEALRSAGASIAPNADWQAVCSMKDFAFRNWYDGDYLCKRQAGNPPYYCLVWVDEGA